MSPPRRRSARLASASASAVKARATPGLGTVAEGHETPIRTTKKRINTQQATESPPMSQPRTPISSALKPPVSEMHPSRFHCSTGAPSSALRLGFADIPKGGHTPNGQDGTPSKVNGFLNSNFTFQIAREAADSELSSDAQRMLTEIRGQAAKIKAELVAQREAEGGTDIARRQFAKPKGKVGRFSAAHMAEFKKMDSIEGHASAWRAQEGRFTPVKALKRTSSKANLDATPTSQKTEGMSRSTGITATNEESKSTRLKPSLKRKSSAANLDGHCHDEQTDEKKHKANFTPGRYSCTARPSSPKSTVKRVKRALGDDAATTKPKSLVTSPSKSDSVFSRLSRHKKTPTATSVASARHVSKPTILLVTSPSKPAVNTLPKSASLSSLNFTVSKAADLKRRIISPTSFSKVKSILQRGKNSSNESISAIPGPQLSQTPIAPRINKEVPAIPLTTPRRKLTKRVMFTPDVVSPLNAQNSPSPQRAGNFKLRPALKTIEPQYAALDDVMVKSVTGHSLYPDLSPLKHLVDSPKDRADSAPASRPGTFTFRSDHTIKFANLSASGFGASPGQSSVRHVHGQTDSSNIPGNFPALMSPSSHANKENEDPTPVKLLPGTAHGMQNKKRHRASSDEDDFENNRAAKKRKNEKVPEGQELLAPRLVKSGLASANTPTRFIRTPGKTLGREPGRTLASLSPTKKVGGLSISRLNMLARPKKRA